MQVAGRPAPPSLTLADPDKDYCEMYNPAFYRSIATGFERVTDRGSKSAYDQALLYLLADDLYLEPAEDQFAVDDAGGERLLDGYDFSRVRVIRP